MWDLVVRGGPLMWPLLACSVVSLAVVIERAVFWLRQGRGRDEAMVERLLREAEQGRFDQAAAIGAEARDQAARVLAAGLAHRDWGLAEAMEVKCFGASKKRTFLKELKMNAKDYLISAASILCLAASIYVRFFLKPSLF